MSCNIFKIHFQGALYTGQDGHRTHKLGHKIDVSVFIIAIDELYIQVQKLEVSSGDHIFFSTDEIALTSICTHI